MFLSKAHKIKETVAHTRIEHTYWRELHMFML